MQSRIAPADLASGPTPELPTLDRGLRLLETDSKSIATGALHALVLDHLLLDGGSALWIDTQGQIAPHHLARIAPSLRVLDRIDVARAFTPYQHYSLIGRLASSLQTDGLGQDGNHIRSGESGFGDVSLVVVPALDGLYCDESALRGGEREGREMLLHALSVLEGIARRHGIPVLVTRSGTQGGSAAVGTPIACAVAGTIRCECTHFGPRFTVDGDFDSASEKGDTAFDTLVYPMGNGWVQTTLAFWREVLGARVSLYDRAGADAAGSPSEASGPAGVGVQ